MTVCNFALCTLQGHHLDMGRTKSALQICKDYGGCDAVRLFSQMNCLWHVVQSRGSKI